jgi:hypothetical protein
MHLGDEQIQRLLHDELGDAVGIEVRDHLETCAPCRQRLDEAGREESEIYSLLSRVDHTAPATQPRSLMVRRSPVPTRNWRRKAAVVVLAVGGAGVAYAAPGSPLPAWIRSIVAAVSGRSAAPSVPVSPSPAQPAQTSGIAVTPGDRFTIRFTSLQARGTASITLTDTPEIVARSVNGIASFVTDVDRLTISNDESAADYEIQIPRAAAWVEVRVAARRLLLKRGAEIESDVSADSLGRYLLPLTPSRR